MVLITEELFPVFQFGNRDLKLLKYADDVLFPNEGPSEVQVILDRQKNGEGISQMFRIFEVYNTAEKLDWPKTESCLCKGGAD